MTQSSLTDQVRLSHQNSDRNGTVIDTFLVHHQAGTNDDAVINAMVTGSKRVSSNYTISNEGRLTLVVDEDLRAWTSGSSTDGGKGAQWDRRSITVEIENETGSPDWKISDAAIEKAALLLVDLKARYGITQVLGHRDLWNQYQASYATYCPGPETVAKIVAKANELSDGGLVPQPPAPTPGGNTNVGVDYAYGLTVDAQIALQKDAQRRGNYTGIIDGIFGKQSVGATQKMLKDEKLLPGNYVVDGVPGPKYGKALQEFAKRGGYTGPIDGEPGAATSAGIVKALQTAPVQVKLIKVQGDKISYHEPIETLAIEIGKALIVMGVMTPGFVNDGRPGKVWRTGVQKALIQKGYWKGTADGLLGRKNLEAIQRLAKDRGGYKGPIDSDPREASWSAFLTALKK